MTGCLFHSLQALFLQSFVRMFDTVVLLPTSRFHVYCVPVTHTTLIQQTQKRLHMCLCMLRMHSCYVHTLSNPK